MKTFSIPASFILALFMDVALQPLRAFYILPPLLFIVAVAWYPYVDGVRQMSIAFVVGVLLDTLYFFPFGTHTTVAVASAFIAKWFRTVLFYSEKPLSRVVVTGILILTASIMILPVSRLL